MNVIALQFAIVDAEGRGYTAFARSLRSVLARELQASSGVVSAGVYVSVSQEIADEAQEELPFCPEGLSA